MTEGQCLGDMTSQGGKLSHEVAVVDLENEEG